MEDVIVQPCIRNSKPIVGRYVVGCLPLKSYLRSTLECLYSQSCLDKISSNISLFSIPKSLNPFASGAPYMGRRGFSLYARINMTPSTI